MSGRRERDEAVRAEAERIDAGRDRSERDAAEVLASEEAVAPDRVGWRELRFRIWQQLPVLIGLVLLWMLLWGQFSLLSLTTGLLLAITVWVVFYLPPVELSGRFNLGWLLLFCITFAAEAAAGSLVVAATAFGPKVRRNAVIAVPLRTRSDFILTATATAVSLVPGSHILDLDRDRAILYVHFLNTAKPGSVEKARRSVYSLERRIVLAVGSRADVEAIGR